MTFGELLGMMLGWLGEFVEWLISFFPRYEIVQWNERGVRYVRGKEPSEIKNGTWWYWPWQTAIVKHHINRQVLRVQQVSLETSDGETVTVGVVFTYFIKEVLKFEVENFDADDSMAEVAQGALRQIIVSHKWADLMAEDKEGQQRLEKLLKDRMASVLSRFGVRVETCRPTDQVRVPTVARIFGVQQMVNVISE